MKREGAVAIKYEAAYLRPLNFTRGDRAAADRAYAKYAAAAADRRSTRPCRTSSSITSPSQAGRLGLPVHIHTGYGCGGYFEIMGANPLLLEPILDDPSLRTTKFVLLHGGAGPFSQAIAPLLMKPNVYTDFSEQTWLLPTRELAASIRYWLEWYPEKVLFGTDLSPGTPTIDWEEIGWQTTTSGREALAMALTGMMDDGEITRDRERSTLRAWCFAATRSSSTAGPTAKPTHPDTMNISRALALTLALSAPLAAQDATIVYRLGHDTVAIESFTRTPARLVGETVVRSGPAVTRTQYDASISGGKATSLIVRRRQGDGSRHSEQSAGVAVHAGRGFHAPRDRVEGQHAVADVRGEERVHQHSGLLVRAVRARLRTRLARRDRPRWQWRRHGRFPEIRGRHAPHARRHLRHGGSLRQDGHLVSTDGFFTTNKAIGTRVAGKVDIAAIAPAMKATGVLSPRAQAYAGFNRGPIFVSYGRPAVRERTVWGGTLVPFDTIWRTGANEATHLATSKTIALGDMTLAPGLYTLWIQHTRSATYLIVNKQVGQWGTEYQAVAGHRPCEDGHGEDAGARRGLHDHGARGGSESRRARFRVG